MAKWITLAVLGIVVVGMLMLGGCISGTYNSLVTYDQNVKKSWSQVENVYQRRADLIPNLVETVKGAAAFEKETFTQVAEARSKVNNINVSPAMLSNPQAFAQFQQAQDGLGAALSKLMVVIEKYPDLKANSNFTALQAQLEGTENRITVERQNYNNAVGLFNTYRLQFPTNLIANMFGFPEKAYFTSKPNADVAPTVSFK